MQVDVELLEGPSLSERPIEIVERKGLGHPDTICDALAEEYCAVLCRFYTERFGMILHHNVDKLLLAGGAAEPCFGGGRITRPIGLYYAGRATLEHRGIRVPVDDLMHESYRNWMVCHLPLIDSELNVQAHCLVRGGAIELVHTFGQTEQRTARRANDTSCGVGYAPLSDLERTVLQIEKYLNSDAFKTQHPEVGTDIKIMATRLERRVELSLACAMIDRHLPDLDAYRTAIQAVTRTVDRLVTEMNVGEVTTTVNHADDYVSGDVYLTVSGTSAEAGDDGETGRGNRVNGLITPLRPMTMEAVAGKNPVTHVGKLYNVLANRIAQTIVGSIDPVLEVECYLVSRIGAPVDRPQSVNLRLRLAPRSSLNSVKPAIDAVVESQLSSVYDLTPEFMSRRLTIY